MICGYIFVGNKHISYFNVVGLFTPPVFQGNGSQKDCKEAMASIMQKHEKHVRNEFG